jgi:hypothetical protein
VGKGAWFADGEFDFDVADGVRAGVGREGVEEVFAGGLPGVGGRRRNGTGDGASGWFRSWFLGHLEGGKAGVSWTRKHRWKRRRKEVGGL